MLFRAVWSLFIEASEQIQTCSRRWRRSVSRSRRRSSPASGSRCETKRTSVRQTSGETLFEFYCLHWPVLTLHLLSAWDLRPLRPLRRSPHPAVWEERLDKALLTQTENKRSNEKTPEPFSTFKNGRQLHHLCFFRSCTAVISAALQFKLTGFEQQHIVDLPHFQGFQFDL